jgi:hypothetical protein
MRASRDELPELLGTAIRGSDWGDLRATVVAMPAGTDARPLFKGLTLEFSNPVAHEQVLDVIKRNAAIARTASV